MNEIKYMIIQITQQRRRPKTPLIPYAIEVDKILCHRKRDTPTLIVVGVRSFLFKPDNYFPFGQRDWTGHYIYGVRIMERTDHFLALYLIRDII